MKVIHKARTGSHLFGTSTPSSDIDIKGVYIPSAREILMPTIPDHVSYSTGNAKTKNTSDDVDEEYYALHKFMGMLAKGDMVATEMLFSPAMEPKIYSDNRYMIWNEILMNKDHFLSRECKGFVGYVQRQASNYSVKGDRLNELQHALEFITNLEWNYPDAKRFSDIPDYKNVIARFCAMDGKKHTSHETVPAANGQEIFHFICCDRKVPATVPFHVGSDIFAKTLAEYGNRARAAAESKGKDWKALSHAVRVGEEAIELLSTGNLTFPRPNAAYLLDIKTGNVAYEKVADELEILLAGVEEAAKNSNLRHHPDQSWIEGFVREIYAEEVVSSYHRITFA